MADGTFDLYSFHQAKAMITTECSIEIVSMEHLDLSQKYDQAARYPWLPVAPDPVEPD